MDSITNVDITLINKTNIIPRLITIIQFTVDGAVRNKYTFDITDPSQRTLTISVTNVDPVRIFVLLPDFTLFINRNPFIVIPGVTCYELHIDCTDNILVSPCQSTTPDINVICCERFINCHPNPNDPFINCKSKHKCKHKC